jgi:hypothetical protein
MTVETIGRTRAISLEGLPSGMVEGGGPYTGSFTVVNQSTYTGGTAAPYTFVVVVGVSVGGYVVYSGEFTMATTAGQTKTQSFSFSIPSGRSGSGTATALLLDTTGSTQLAAATPLTFTVSSITITAKGTITW